MAEEPLRERVLADAEARTIAVPHLGITLRVLLGAASAAAQDCAGTWSIVYQKKTIGTLELKRFKDLS